MEKQRTNDFLQRLKSIRSQVSVVQFQQVHFITSGGLSALTDLVVDNKQYLYVDNYGAIPSQCKINIYRTLRGGDMAKGSEEE